MVSLGVRSYIMPGLSMHLVQELKAGILYSVSTQTVEEVISTACKTYSEYIF